MSDELHKLNHRIRQQKKVLKLQIRAVRMCVKSGQKRVFRHFAGRLKMPKSEIQFVRQMEARLEQHRAAMRELVELTRNKKAYVCNRCNSSGKERVVPITGKQPFLQNCPTCNKNGRRKPKPGCKPYM